MIYREWVCECPCGFKGKVLGWNYDLPLPCPTCGTPTEVEVVQKGRSAGVIGDEFGPGYLDVPHGVCHDDGTPRRFDTKTELKRALNAKGLTILGDTPKPYRV